MRDDYAGSISSPQSSKGPSHFIRAATPAKQGDTADELA
jgi:hypothetical protein